MSGALAIPAQARYNLPTWDPSISRTNTQPGQHQKRASSIRGASFIRVVAFGEIMLRLKSPGYERLLQSAMLEATFGGGEANVCVSLANFGMNAAFITVLPDNDIAAACLRQLRSFGVDIGGVVTKPGRIGVYNIETGLVQRSGKVIYDRTGSTLALAKPGDIDWKKAFAGAGWFHITGITPAISASAAELSMEAVKTAKELGLHVSCDLNYRKNLWKYGKRADEVMPDLVRYVDTVIANEEDFQQSFGLDAEKEGDADAEGLDVRHYEAIAQTAMHLYPNIHRVAITLRESINADHNNWSACLDNGREFFLSRKYAMTDIVDRVGGGDSFGGGLIYGLAHYPNEKTALEFAVAASCLKHSIPGDFSRVSVLEAEALMRGGGSGRVQR